MTEQERILFVDITYLVTEALEALGRENQALADADASVD